MRSVVSSAFVLALLVLSGCGGSASTPPVVEPVDANVAPDTALAPIDGEVEAAVDGGPNDVAVEVAADSASAEASDAGTTDTSVVDAGPPFDIIGTASGACGTIKSFVKTTTSVTVEIPMLFGPTDKYERSKLSPGGQNIFDKPNAGGTSKDSEVMTYELLLHCEGAALLKTEKEIKYGPPPDGGASTITDLLITIGGEKIGVNPNRVFKPMPLTMTDAEVRDQLVKKLESLKASSARVLPEDKWVKQILHVWVPDATFYDAVKRVLPTIDEATKSNTIILITRTTGGGFLYCDPDPAPGAECPPIK